MRADLDAQSPLRPNGVYRYRGREYTAVDLSTEDSPWYSTGLIRWLPGESRPREILYLRHRDLVLLRATDFAPVGSSADLEDTGRDDERDPVDVGELDQGSP